MSQVQRGSDLDELTRSLIALRDAAGLSRARAARALGIHPSTMLRAERAQGTLSVEQVAQLLTLYDAPQDERVRLLALAKLRRDEFVPARVIFQQGAHQFQRRLRQLEAETQEVRAFQPGAIVGTLQTSAYANVVFSQHGSPEEAAEAVLERHERHSLLDDTARQWTLIQTQGALEWGLGGPMVMAEQLDEIAAASARPNVKLGIIPARVPASVLPMHGFHLHRKVEGWTVALGSREGTALISDPERVDDYQALFAELEGLAVFDDDARTLLARVAQDYRKDAGT